MAGLLVLFNLPLVACTGFGARVGSAAPAINVAPSAQGNDEAAGEDLPTPADAATPEPTATVAPEPTPNKDLATFDPKQLKPNELGRILILEYHQFGPTEERWTRSYANFHKDLERLYRTGYRPIGMNEYIENRIDVPAGRTPIIFTFDDSSPGQFRYLPGADGKPAIDPTSAVGMLVAFNREHPDWRLRGTFFVLAGVVPEHRLFGQPEYGNEKLRQLVEMGFELGNHTYWHMQLSKLDKAGVNEQLGKAVKAIQDAVPGYEVNSVALPLGAHPRDTGWVARGSWEGTEYHNRAFLEVSGGGAYSPSNRWADLIHLPRIQATHMQWDFYTAFLDYYDQHPDERYVSDGNPDRVVFPASEAQNYRPGNLDRPLPDPAEGFRAVGLH